jgi:hypothetical protein
MSLFETATRNINNRENSKGTTTVEPKPIITTDDEETETSSPDPQLSSNELDFSQEPTTTTTATTTITTTITDESPGEPGMTYAKWMACIALALAYTTSFQQGACMATILNYINIELGITPSRSLLLLSLLPVYNFYLLFPTLLPLMKCDESRIQNPLSTIRLSFVPAFFCGLRPAALHGAFLTFEFCQSQS